MPTIRASVPVFVLENADGLQYLWSNGKAIQFFVREVAEQWLKTQQEVNPGMGELSIRDVGEISVEFEVGQFPETPLLCPTCAALNMGLAMTEDNREG